MIKEPTNEEQVFAYLPICMGGLRRKLPCLNLPRISMG